MPAPDLECLRAFRYDAGVVAALGSMRVKTEITVSPVGSSPGIVATIWAGDQGPGGR